MQLRDDIKNFINSIPSNVTLVAATKYVSFEEMKVLFDNGINNFGENRVDAFLDKYEHLKEYDIKWHFIGHLQRNKAKYVIDKIDYLHSLDSLELAYYINKKRRTPLKCFIEVAINNEENKNGVELDNIYHFVEEILKLENIELIGLMMMSVRYSSHEELLNQFDKILQLRENLENEYNIKLPYLSMGMSDDYIEAISKGATHIRLGRILFKE